MSRRKRISKWTDKLFLTDEIWEGASVQAHVLVDKYSDRNEVSVTSNIKLSDCNSFISWEFDVASHNEKDRIKRKRRKAKRLKKVIDKWYEEYMAALDAVEKVRDRQ